MNKVKTRILDGSPSLFLDALRLLAALIVVYEHANVQWFSLQTPNPNLPGNKAHAAVVVFFVLSGYVIAHTTTSNNRGLMQYAQARLSRLCSVVIPALIITALAELIISQIDPALHIVYSRGVSWPRYLVSGAFMNEIWFFSAAPPFNGPLWSLSFEFWYYTIFGLWFYRGKGLTSFILPVAACFVAGPKILVMMPIWLAGCAAYQLPRPALHSGISWLIIFALLGASIFAINNVMPYPFAIGHSSLSFANQFLTDWFLGLLISVAVWILPAGIRMSPTPKWHKWFRRLADLTFPIYLLHYPILILWDSLFDFQINNSAQLWQAVTSVVFISMCVGVFLEKQRPKWVRFFDWLLNKIRSLAIKVYPRTVPKSNIL